MSKQTSWEEDTDSFFDIQDAGRLTLTPLTTLRRWVTEGVVKPSRLAIDEDGHHVSGFSLWDLAFIRIVRHLTTVGEPKLRLEDAVLHVSHALSRLSPIGTHWADAHLLSKPGPLMLVADGHGITQSLPGGAGQRVFEEFLDLQVRQMILGPESLLIPAELLEHIEMNPRKRDGHPVIRGTNISTTVVFDIMRRADGLARAKSLFPFVSAEAFLAVGKFHREYLHERVKVPTG